MAARAASMAPAEKASATHAHKNALPQPNILTIRQFARWPDYGMARAKPATSSKTAATSLKRASQPRTDE